MERERERAKWMREKRVRTSGERDSLRESPPMGNERKREMEKEMKETASSIELFV